MAHFAQLDESNVVTQVIVVHNDECCEDGVEKEEVGVAFCQSLFGPETVWKQTSYNASFRKNFAGIGFAYDPELNAFIPPKPYPSWALDEETCQWIAPVSMPDDGKVYTWDEEMQVWREVKTPPSD